VTALAPYVRWRATLPDLSAQPADDIWEVFQAAHEGRCAICRQPPKATAKRKAKLIIDHCHVTGWIRGLLCRGCNQRAGSGWLHQRLALTETPAVDLYVQFPPAAWCGLYRRYEPAFWGDPHDRLERDIWHAGPDGLEQGSDVIGRELAAHMRTRLSA
jgi:hypothetical protein